jgi:7,8-dihydropterin-6-yl-methyl-4-(beta-D-ribofuranosyl)aminobenzene 5'-phosphate synthase
MSIRITTLSENTAGMGDFLAEWGLSILIQADDYNVLLDTGASISAIHNAETLGIDLNSVDKLVLCHGHYDHTGGLREVLRIMKKEVEIVAHPDVWQAKYSKRKNEEGKFIGIPFSQNELESLGARFVYSRQPFKINENILTTGEIPMITEYETIDSALMVKENEVLKSDPLMDDRAIIIKTSKGLVIILGCAHRGMINTIYHAQEITGIKDVYAVIGGSHLIGSSEERLWQTIAAIKEINVQKLGLCHCTDLPVISALAQEFREKFLFNRSGSVIELT